MVVDCQLWKDVFAICNAAFREITHSIAKSSRCGLAHNNWGKLKLLVIDTKIYTPVATDKQIEEAQRHYGGVRTLSFYRYNGGRETLFGYLVRINLSGMSRNGMTRSDRVAQMTKQEELIAKKRQEIEEKMRTRTLAKAVAEAQSGTTKPKKHKDRFGPFTLTHLALSTT